MYTGSQGAESTALEARKSTLLSKQSGNLSIPSFEKDSMMVLSSHIAKTILTYSALHYIAYFANERLWNIDRSRRKQEKANRRKSMLSLHQIRFSHGILPG